MTSLATDRLVLRPFDAGDAEAHARLYADPEVTRWLGDGPWYGEAARERSALSLRRFAEHWDAHGWGVWAVTDGRTGEVMGQCGLKYLQIGPEGTPPDVEVLYALAPRFWGGLVSMPLLTALFSTLGIFGAYLVGVKLIGIDAGAFWGNMQAAVDFRRDIVNGIIKSVVFGFAVSIIAVFEGYDARPTAEGVSSATTRTVVASSLAILALDFILTVFMFRGIGV